MDFTRHATRKRREQVEAGAPNFLQRDGAAKRSVILLGPARGVFAAVLVFLAVCTGGPARAQQAPPAARQSALVPANVASRNPQP